MMLRTVPLVALSVSLAACGGSPPERGAQGEWVGTITTEDGVTTVVNEAGSVWGGAARLVEEASIGVDVGADEYMLGGITGLWASDDRIFVADWQVPAVRTYDYEGNFVGNLGGPGQGPGEYRDPGAMIGTSDGRLYLLDDHNNKVHVYTVEGEHVDTWQVRNVPFWPIAVAADGTLWLPVTVRDGPGPDDFRRAIQAHGPGGAFGPRHVLRDSDFEAPTIDVGGRERLVPFTPRRSWAPNGAAEFVVGVSDRYRFQIEHDGRARLVVEKYWEPAPIDAAHAEWLRRRIIADSQGNAPGWTWDGAEIPSTLPAYAGLNPTADGRIWVGRFGPAADRRPDCVTDPIAAGPAAARENPCWVSTWAPADVFDVDGRFLGSVELPSGVELYYNSFFARGDVFIAALHDEAGTPMVKRYRLVLPREAG